MKNLVLRLIYFLMMFHVWTSTSGQPFTIVLGRPTDTDITANIVFQVNADYFLEYGSDSTFLSTKTITKKAVFGVPEVVELTGLTPNQRVYYRLYYKPQGNSGYIPGPVYSFHTQRAPDRDFIFTIEADEHLYDKKGIASLYQVTLGNILKDKPDFLLSLGDTFGDDHTPEETTSEDMKELHEDYLKYLGKVTHSIPFFFCLGNHEGENGYYLNQNAPNNIAVYGTLWRKYYYPNPYPNDFYSGNMQQENHGIGYPENYYAFTWGNALIVVLDVYRDCTINEKPKNWDWTLGEVQYRWFKSILENSQAPFKFVFAHHTRGQGRGGVSTAKGFEWGGYDNGKYEFDQMRPGWGKPIHDLMVDNKVSIFFQGHDHLFALDKLDGVYYQTVPMPSDTTYSIGVTDNGDAYSGVVIEGCGHLRVNVQADCATIDYVQAYLPKDTLNGLYKNGNLAYSYSIGSCQSTSTEQVPSAEYTLFPNPGDMSVHIHNPYSDDPSDTYVSLYDLQGRVIIPATSMNPKMTTLNISHVPNGIYLVKLTSIQKADQFFKLSIQHN